MLAALVALQVSFGQSAAVDTLRIRDVLAAPSPNGRFDTLPWGAPQITIPTRQGTVSLWLLRAMDTVFVAGTMPDRSDSWADVIAVCLDVAGDRTPKPGHDDFQFALHRLLDSSVVYRGSNGRWQPPRDDPDWRVGPTHGGGGWEAAAVSDGRGWSVVLRLDPAWVAGSEGRWPAIAFVVHDDDPNGWYRWPVPYGTEAAVPIEDSPTAWIPIGPAR
jgi:hypothetical protein